MMMKSAAAPWMMSRFTPITRQSQQSIRRSLSYTSGRTASPSVTSHFTSVRSSARLKRVAMFVTVAAAAATFIQYVYADDTIPSLSSRTISDELNALRGDAVSSDTSKLLRFIRFYLQRIPHVSDVQSVMHSFNGVAGTLKYLTENGTAVTIQYRRLPTRSRDQFAASVTIAVPMANTSPASAVPITVDTQFDMPLLWTFRLFNALDAASMTVHSVTRNRYKQDFTSLAPADQAIIKQLIQDLAIAETSALIAACFQYKRLMGSDLLAINAMGTRQGVSGQRPAFFDAAANDPATRSEPSSNGRFSDIAQVIKTSK